MEPENSRRQAGFNSRTLRSSEPISSRPDRLALWAVLMAVIAMLFAAGTGRSDSGPAGAGPEPEAVQTSTNR